MKHEIRSYEHEITNEKEQTWKINKKWMTEKRIRKNK